MPSGNLTLLDLVTTQRNDILTGLVEDVTTYAPEFGQIPVETRAGTFYKVARRTALPTSQFRIINNGTTPTKSAYAEAIKEMFFVDTLINVDEAVIKGQDGSIGDLWTREAQGVLQSTLITIGAQVYYGTSSDANGFTGLRSQLSGTVAAGGTTNSTSAFLAWMNPWGVHFDVGRDGEIALPPPMRQQIAAASPGTGNLFAWVSNLSCYIGLTVNSASSVWAITGITTHLTSSTYDQACSDVNAGNLVSLIPVNRRQGLCWFMNRLSYFTLQASRSSINQQVAGASGQPGWAPPPNLLEGYPIVVTDSLTNTESN